jgi:broad specificity phosphatase PhoE
VRLFLVRHAQSGSNIQHAIDTAIPGAPLTDLGLEQAARLAVRLTAEHFDVVAASPLTRAQQTARPLADERGLPVLTLDGLREVEAGDLEMATAAGPIEIYRNAIVAWGTGDLDVTIPGATSGPEFFARYDAAVRALEDAGASAVAISHGAAIRIWIAARCRGVDSAGIADRSLANTGGAIVEGSTEAGWELTGWLEEIVGEPAYRTLAEPKGTAAG